MTPFIFGVELAHKWAISGGSVHEFNPHEIGLALSGRADLTRRLIEYLMPTVQGAVARTLRSRRAAQHRDLAHEVADLTQSVMLHLFESGGRVLLAWQPDRGKALRGYVYMVASRRTLDALNRQWRKREIPTEPQHLTTSAVYPTDQVESRSTLRVLLTQLETTLSPGDWDFFRRRFVLGDSVTKIGVDLQMSRKQIYNKIARLKQKIQALRLTIDASPRCAS